MIHPRRYSMIAVAVLTAVAVLLPTAGSGAPLLAGSAAPAGAVAVATGSGQIAPPAPTGFAAPYAAPGTGAPAVPPASVAARNEVTLKAVLDLAEQHSLQLQQATLQVSKARVNLDRWKAATGSTLVFGLQQRYMVSLPADDTTAAALRRAYEITLQQASLSLEASRQSVRLGVTRAYLEWQKADALATAQQAALDRANAQADTARKALNAGTAAKYDVLQVDAQVSAQKAALKAAETGRETARLTLSRLVGSPIGADVRPAATPTDAAEAPEAPAANTGDAASTAPAADSTDAEATALQQRPEVAIGKLGVQAREADLDLLSQYYPADDPVVAGARLAVQEAALNLASTQADIRLQVEQAQLAIASATERLAALADAETQSQEALRLAQLRFDAGAATSVEVIAAQAALTQAEAARIQAAADRIAAQASLQQAIGSL